MSWIEKVKTKLIIKTGDGKEYNPYWLNPSFDVDFNTTEFNFPNIEGSLVDRREKSGNKYTLDVFFQGENNLDEMKAFMASTSDKRVWTIQHPIYDVLIVQPISIKVDNSLNNVSRLTIQVIETITETLPKSEIIIADKIAEDNANLNNLLTAFSTDFDTESVVALTNINQSIFAKIKSKIIETTDASSYYNTFNVAQNAVNNSASLVSFAITSVQTFIQAPALFTQSVQSRLSMLSVSFSTLKENIIGSYGTLANMPNSLKNQFSSNGSSIIAGVCLASSLPVGNDYANRVEITRSMEIISDLSAEFLADLDSMQVGNGSNLEDFIPSAEIITNLQNLVNFTLSNLFNLALNAKQERFYTLPEDSDFITLTHQFYGLDNLDQNIDELIRNNNFGLNGILNIKKGTVLTYYI